MGRRPSGSVHVVRVRSRHRVASGETREYESPLLRRSFRRADGTVGKQTVANLSMLPGAAVDAIEAVLKGKTLVAADAALQVSKSLPHGHVALVDAAARRLGLAQLLGPSCRERDLAYALIVSRVVRPKPKLSTLVWWDDVTLGVDLGWPGRAVTRCTRRWIGYWAARTRSKPHWRVGTCVKVGWRCSTCPRRGLRAATVN